MDIGLRPDALLRNPYVHSGQQTMYLADGFLLIRRWQEFLSASGRVNASTQRQYRRALVALIADICKDPRDITEDDIIAWMLERDPKGGAVSLTLRAAHSFYGWALAREEIVPSPVRALLVPKKKYGRPPALSEENLTLVLGAARAYRDPRLAPTLELMYATGARIGSIVGLRAEDLDFKGSSVYFRIAKNDDPYEVPMNERARVACRELLALADWHPVTAPHRRPTLVGVGRSRLMQMIQDIEDSSGVPVWSHLFRHTLATEIAHDPDVPIVVLSKILNHDDPRTTMRYVADREGAMAAALAGR